MILSQFEQAIRHWRRPQCDVAEARHHGGEIIAPVEAVLEFGKVARQVLCADRTVGAGDRVLDVAKDGVDPFEGGGKSGPATAPGDDRLMCATGIQDTVETAQAVTEEDAGGLEVALCHSDDVGSSEAPHPAQFEADRFAFGSGLNSGHGWALVQNYRLGLGQRHGGVYRAIPSFSG